MFNNSVLVGLMITSMLSRSSLLSTTATSFRQSVTCKGLQLENFLNSAIRGHSNDKFVISESQFTRFLNSAVVVADNVCSFTSVTATSVGYQCTNPELTVKTSTFTSCSSTGNGGGISAEGTKATVDDSKFTACLSYAHGGALYAVMSMSITIRNCVYEICYTDYLTQQQKMTGLGGSVYMNTASATVTGTTFTEGTASCGGAVYYDGDELMLTDVQFKACRACTVMRSSSSVNWNADGNGGALYIVSSNRVEFVTVSFVECCALYGSAIFASDVGTLALGQTQLVMCDVYEETAGVSYGYAMIEIEGGTDPVFLFTSLLVKDCTSMVLNGPAGLSYGPDSIRHLYMVMENVKTGFYPELPLSAGYIFVYSPDEFDPTPVVGSDTASLAPSSEEAVEVLTSPEPTSESGLSTIELVLIVLLAVILFVGIVVGIILVSRTSVCNGCFGERNYADGGADRKAITFF